MAWGQYQPSEGVSGEIYRSFVLLILQTGKARSRMMPCSKSEAALKKRSTAVSPAGLGLLVV